MDATLEATSRDTFGKNEARRTRASGRVPAVLYGEGKDATPIAVEGKWKAVSDADMMLVHVIMPKAEEVAAPADAAAAPVAAAEPEVIKKGKKEEEAVDKDAKKDDKKKDEKKK